MSTQKFPIVSFLFLRAMPRMKAYRQPADPPTKRLTRKFVVGQAQPFA